MYIILKAFFNYTKQSSKEKSFIIYESFDIFQKEKNQFIESNKLFFRKNIKYPISSNFIEFYYY